MIPISIQEFIGGFSVPVDLFVRLADQKFVLIAKAGSKTQNDQLNTFREKQVEYLWVRRQEYSKISKQNVTLAGMVVNKLNIKLNSKTNILSAAAKTVFTQLEHLGISLEIYNNARQVTEATMALIQSHRELSSLLEGLNQSNDELLNHSLAVSALSVMMGVALGWEKKATLEKLAVGGLLHDIGLKTLPPELLLKPLAQMSYEESVLYETHPYKGMQLLQSLGMVPDDIVSIVYEHQENALGQGYPQRLKDMKIHPLAKVVSVADQFTQLTIRNVNCPSPKSAREALMFIEHTLNVPFNRTVFMGLKRIVDSNGLSQAS